jgi:hypothetical protein
MLIPRFIAYSGFQIGAFPADPGGSMETLTTGKPVLFPNGDCGMIKWLKNKSPLLISKKALFF